MIQVSNSGIYKRLSSYPETRRPAVGLTRPPPQQAPDSVHVREVPHTCPFNSEAEKEWRYARFLLHAVMV
jgi:hypothetical protein